MEIVAIVGLLFMLLFVGGGILIWRIFTRKLPQPDYRLSFSKSMIFILICGALTVLLYTVIKVLQKFLPVG